VAQMGHTIVRDREASERRKVRGVVGEQLSNEQSEERRSDENKRHENEQGIKKTKVWCSSRHVLSGGSHWLQMSCL
jgi:hypothetical protein